MSLLELIQTNINIFFLNIYGSINKTFGKIKQASKQTIIHKISKRLLGSEITLKLNQMLQKSAKEISLIR